MKSEIANGTDSIATCAAYLANNIEFVCSDLEPSMQGTFCQCGYSILVFILPRYHRGEKVSHTIKTGSVLAEIALLKMMKLQSQEIINHIQKKDPRFADWVSGSLMSFIHKAANKYADRYTQLGIREGEL